MRLDVRGEMKMKLLSSIKMEVINLEELKDKPITLKSELIDKVEKKYSAAPFLYDFKRDRRQLQGGS